MKKSLETAVRLGIIAGSVATASGILTYNTENDRFLCGVQNPQIEAPLGFFIPREFSSEMIDEILGGTVRFTIHPVTNDWKQSTAVVLGNEGNCMILGITDHSLAGYDEQDLLEIITSRPAVDQETYTVKQNAFRIIRNPQKDQAIVIINTEGKQPPYNPVSFTENYYFRLWQTNTPIIGFSYPTTSGENGHWDFPSSDLQTSLFTASISLAPYIWFHRVAPEGTVILNGFTDHGGSGGVLFTENINTHKATAIGLYSASVPEYGDKSRVEVLPIHFTSLLLQARNAGLIP